MDKPKFIDVNLKISTDTECNCAPWWLITDPRQMMSPNVHTVAGMTTGPFFSREEAQQHLDARRYAFSEKARVYSHSGYWSKEYRNAYGEAYYKQTGKRN